MFIAPTLKCAQALAFAILFLGTLAPARSDERPDAGSADLLAHRAAYLDPLATGQGRWWAAGFAGVVATHELSSIVFRASPDLGRSYIAGLSLGREFGALSDALRLEWHAVGAGVFGRADYVDLRLELGLRLVRFPWNRHVFTSAGLFVGPSYLTARPRYEAEEGEFRRWKNGLTFELTLADPERPATAFLLRLHHRSSIFGLLPHAGTPSDFLTLGISRRF